MRKGRNRKQRVNKNEKAAGNCFRACAESEQGMWVKVGDTCTRANSGEANFRVPSAKLVVPLSPLAVSIRLPFQFPSFREVLRTRYRFEREKDKFWKISKVILCLFGVEIKIILICEFVNIVNEKI